MEVMRKKSWSHTQTESDRTGPQTWHTPPVAKLLLREADCQCSEVVGESTENLKGHSFLSNNTEWLANVFQREKKWAQIAQMYLNKIIRKTNMTPGGIFKLSGKFFQFLAMHVITIFTFKQIHSHLLPLQRHWRIPLWELHTAFLQFKTQKEMSYFSDSSLAGGRRRQPSLTPLRSRLFLP